MLKKLRNTVLVLLLLAPNAGAAGEEAGVEALAELGWMAGCWAGEADGTRSEECWLAPGGGIMLGMHRDVFSNGKSFFEFLRIAAHEDGLAYLASPAGRPPTAFRLIRREARRAVFENPEHDFPQRILYWRDGDVLHARIEGETEGEARSAEWAWRRVEAPGTGTPISSR